jgi:hypothetical protein
MDNQPQEAPHFQYQLLDPQEDKPFKEKKIRKSGITAEFTIAQVEEHEETLRTFKKERAAEIDVERARMENVRHFHPVVDTLSDVELTAVALFKESKTVVEKAEAKLKEVDQALEEYAKEKDDIMRTLGFVPTDINQTPRP